MCDANFVGSNSTRVWSSWRTLCTTSCVTSSMPSSSLYTYFPRKSTLPSHSVPFRSPSPSSFSPFPSVCPFVHCLLSCFTSLHMQLLCISLSPSCTIVFYCSHSIRSFIGIGVGAGANVLLRFHLLAPHLTDALIFVNCSAAAAGWLEWGSHQVRIRIFSLLIQ